MACSVSTTLLLMMRLTRYWPCGSSAVETLSADAPFLHRLLMGRLLPDTEVIFTVSLPLRALLNVTVMLSVNGLGETDLITLCAFALTSAVA